MRLQVTMAVNLTVGQSQSAFQSSTATQPIATFLGDHVASVTLGSTTPGTGNQVQPTDAGIARPLLSCTPEPRRWLPYGGASVTIATGQFLHLPRPCRAARLG